MRPSLPLTVRIVLLALLLAAFPACFTEVPRPDSTGDPVTAPTATVTPTPDATAVPPETPFLAEATPTPSPPPTPSQTRSSGTPTPELPDSTATPALKLDVFAPIEGESVPGTVVAVYGVTEPAARVSVGGAETVADSQGGFRLIVSLEVGTNLLEVSATDDAGNREIVARTVSALGLPFLLLVTEPEKESVVSGATLPLSGRTGPNAIVSINGKSVPVDPFGYFSVSVLLEEGPNFIDVVATSDDGRTLSEVVSVIFRPPSQ